MTQLEYGDYYKFASSAGIALIAGAVIAPWMFFREPFDLAMEATKIALLTPDAQNAIHARQHLVVVAAQCVPFAVGAMGMFGTFLTCYGLFGWRKRQKVRDENENLQNKQLARELKSMSPEEIESKAKSGRDIPDEPDSVGIELQASAATSPTSALAVEQALLGKIGSCLDPSMQMLTNKRLGNADFDALIKTSERLRIVVEIKYIRKGFNRNWVLEANTNLALKMALYKQTFDEDVRGLLIVVIATSDSPLARRMKAISEELRRELPSLMENLRTEAIYEADIVEMPCEELKRILFG